MAIRRTLAQFSDDIATADIAADAIDGTKLADNAVDSEHYTDGSIDTAHIADNQVTLAKMAGGADGSLITYSGSQDPELVAPGTTGQVLTSRGNASTPTFQAPAGIDCDADSWLYSRFSVVLYSSNSVFDFDTVIKTGSNISESAGSVTVGTAGWYYIFWK